MRQIYWKALSLIALLASGLSFNAHAQTGTDTLSRDYVINLKGDTIKGTVLSVSDGAVRIDPFTATHTVRYKADEIKEACKTGQVYTPIKADLTFRSIVILKRIEHGKINLYELYQQAYNNGGSQTTWYAEKPGVPAAEIKTSGMGGISRSDRKKNFLALIADNAELTKQFQAQNDFSFDALLALIQDYNKQAVDKAK